MKTTKPAVILLALVLLLTAAGAQSAEKPAKKEISNTRTASCLVKITSDPVVLPLSDIAIDYLLRSSGVAGKAARDILNISPDIASELFIFEDIEKMFPGSASGIGVPPEFFPRRSPAPARTTTTRTPTARTSTRPAATPTARPRTRTTTRRTTTRPTTPTRPTTRRTTAAPSPTLAAEQTILFHLRVDLSEAEVDKPAAEEFMMALIENLRSALRGAFDQYNDKLNNQLNLAGEEADRAEIDLVQMQNDLSNISDSRDLSRQSILSDIRTLRQKLQSTIMQRASDETLYEATAKRIAETQNKRQKLAANDTITRELKSIIAVHRRHLVEIERLYNVGKASAANVQDVKEKIIRANIELAQRREQIISPPGSVVISSLNDELASLATNMALAQQEKQSLEEQLEDAKDLLRKADPYELLSLKADIAKQNLEEALLWRARLGRNIRSIQPPDVTVIGAE